MITKKQSGKSKNLSLLESKLRKLIREEITKKNRLTESNRKRKKKTLLEYMARPGDSITEIGALNIFGDMAEGQLISEYEEEFGESEEWLQVEKKYIPIAEKLWKIVERNAKIKLTEDEIYDLEHVWYDGTDAYGSVDDALENLPEIYDEQIKTVIDILRNRRVKIRMDIKT